MLKSIKFKILVFNFITAILIIALLGTSIFFLKSINLKNEELLNISNSNKIINEMKEAFKAKQADVGWFLLVNSDDSYNDDDDTNYVDVYNEHVKEVDETKSELTDLTKELLEKDNFVELEKLNNQADQSFLDGIAKRKNIAENTKMFRESIENEDELTDKMAEALDAMDEAITNDIKNYLNYTYGLMIIIGIIIIIIVAILGLYFANYLAKPIINVADILNLVAKCDFTGKISPKYLEYKDEIGKMARALDSTRKTIGELIGNIQQTSIVIEDNTKGLSAALLDTTSSIECVAKAVDDMSQGSTELAQNTQVGAEKLEMLSREIEGINSTSSEMKAYIDDSIMAKDNGMAIVKKLQEVVVDNEEVAVRVGEKVFLLDEKSQKISVITEAIKSIVSQINLLSLNATIESARAGEAGKGFAIVANEVKKLALDTAESTVEIDSIIGEFKNIIEDTKNEIIVAKEVIGNTSKMSKTTWVAFDSIDRSVANIIKKIDSLVKDISSMSRDKEEVVNTIEDISAVSEQYASTTEEISASIQQQTANMEQVSNSAESLYDVAIELKKLSEKFKFQ